VLDGSADIRVHLIVQKKQAYLRLRKQYNLYENKHLKTTEYTLKDCRCIVGYKWWGMICCTEPGLTRPCIYCIYLKRVTCKIERQKKNNKTWRWTSIADTDWQETDPTSRQRGRPTETKQQNSDRINIWSKVPRWARCQDILTEWPSVLTWLHLHLHSQRILFCGFKFASYITTTILDFVHHPISYLKLNSTLYVCA
jgi:hypothetical protein